MRAPARFNFAPHNTFLPFRSQIAALPTDPMRPISSFALILLCAAGAAGAQTQAPTLEERMSQSEFHATGLDQLSAAQLQQLNAWLSAHGGASVQYVSPSGAPIFETDTGDRQTIDSSIVGEFFGWRGNTVFTLENGQKWQQSETGAQQSSSKLVNPKVIIKPMLMGSWLMYVDKCGCSVRVKRVE